MVILERMDVWSILTSVSNVLTVIVSIRRSSSSFGLLYGSVPVVTNGSIVND
jgi:hypothetical protein